MTPPRRRRQLDESDVRIRANPRGTRPRSKERPRYEGAVPGQVLTVDRGRYTCLLGGFAEPRGVPSNDGGGRHDGGGRNDGGDRVVVAMKARELGKKGVVVGDRVALVGDVSGEQGALARVVRVDKRTSLLRRSADDVDPAERAVVANADALAIVTALEDPEPRPRMVDRCLVAAYDAGLEPLLVLTKADLRDAAGFLARYAPLDVPAVVTSRVGPKGVGRIVGLDALEAWLAGRVTVLVGHSGVGKSTLVNALAPGSDRATGAVNDVTGRGRHTSTSAVALRLPGPRGGWVIDTPGIRSFGLAHVNPDRIVHHFPDLAAGTADCPRGCTHDEKECGLDAFAAAGGAGPAGVSRLESLRRLLHSRAGDASEDERG